MPEGVVQNYEYDDLDNISKLAEIQGNKIEETSYTYDKNSRLLLQETENSSEVKQNRFSYDLNGNQLTKDEVVKRNGNKVSSKSTQFWYDGYNQLLRVQDINGMYTEYTYNGSGLRTKKESGDKATNYLYDNGNNIIMETDKDNRVTAKNIRGLKLIYRESYVNSIQGEINNMHIFRLRPLHYCIVTTIFLICSAGFLIDDLWFYRVLLSICIIAITVGFIDSLKTSIVLDNKSIRKTGLFKKQEILIKEVEGILLMPTSKGKKIFVGVFGNQKKLFITFWYKDYKKLLKLIVEQFKEEDSLKIDPKILELVSEV